MPRLLTMAELEAELLGGSEQLRDVLLLGCCEMMDSVVREFGSRELPAWRRAVETVRGAMWESVADDRRLGAFGEQTLALCQQSGFHLNEHALSRFVAAYGVASHRVVCVLDRATAARHPADA